jgi:hypothetical protein
LRLPFAAIELLCAEIRIDRLAAADRIGVNAAHLEDVRLGALDGFAGLGDRGLREDARAQLRELRGAFAQIGRLHAELAHHFGILAAVDDGERLLAHPRAENAALLELIRQHEPKDRVILVGGIFGGSFLSRADRLDQLALIERQARNRADGGAQIGGEIAGIEADSPRAHRTNTSRIFDLLRRAPPATSEAIFGFRPSLHHCTARLGSR